MHITQIEINDMPPLEHLHVDCDGRVNLFIGPNTSGKTTILRAIHGLSPGDVIYRGDNEMLLTSEGLAAAPTCCLRFSDDCSQDALKSPAAAVPLLYIPATRVGLPGRNVFDPTYPYRGEDLGTGPPLERLFETGHGIFHGQYVEMAIDRLRNETNDPGFLDDYRRQFRKALTTGFSCAKYICPEVIVGDRPYNALEPDIDVAGPGRVVHYAMAVNTIDDELGDPLYAGVLSSGTQSTLLWIYALALKMASHYSWTEDWEEKPAILLIDEIENHLHPTWQRRVIPSLLKHFPKLQIFATTHSPFVVAGLRAGQVHLLKRDENGVVTATTNTEDVIGWTADEILRNIMDVEEPTDQLTVDRANRLRQLREKEILTPEEESEMNGLRRQVNEDLLSKGGPVEAQRERYADLMQKFLLSRQSELSQDGA